MAVIMGVLNCGGAVGMEELEKRGWDAAGKILA
jgi:hypothetical protein